MSMKEPSVTKSCAVTGATGFIGSSLVRHLAAEGWRVRCLVRDEDRARELFDGLDIEYVIGDVTRPESLAGLASGVDVVFHLAALMGHDLPSDVAFAKFRRVNVEGTRAVITACAGEKLERFVHVSSTAALGLLDVAIVTEETVGKPWTPYQVSKWESEELVREATLEGRIPGVIVRPSMVYGPGFKGDFLTVARVVKKGFFPRIGRGENLSPALYIDDCVEALASCATRGKLGETYFLSSEQSYPLDQVVGIIARALGVKVRLIRVPAWIAIAGARVLEWLFDVMRRKPIVTARNIRSTITDRVFDVSKSREDLGFVQHVSIEDGLTRAVAYFKQQGWV